MVLLNWVLNFIEEHVQVFLRKEVADADSASKKTDRRPLPGGVIMCGGACV